MLESKQAVTIILTLNLLVLSGCRGGHANFAPSRSSTSALSLGNRPGSPSSTPGQTPPIAKRLPRDSAFSIYNNPGYGVSFRYPRIYALEEVVEEEGSTLQTQQSLSAEQPSAILLASVEIPDDAYPNTTFAGGHLQFAINPAVTDDTCRSFAAPPDQAGIGIAGATTVQGISFHWGQHGSSAGDTAYENRDYAGFSNGTCYEFFLQVGSTSLADPDGHIAQADIHKIFRALEKIVLSLQVRPTPAAPSHK